MEVLERLLNVALIVATLRTTAPILLVALGGSFTTKAGIFNIGLEGQMLVGAFFAVHRLDLDRLALARRAVRRGGGAGASPTFSRFWSSPSGPTRSSSAWRSTSWPAA